MTTQDKTNRIVVGVDGSEPSREALRWAAFLAGATGASIQAVTAWQRLGANGWATGYASVEAPIYWNPSADAEKVLQASLDEVFGTQRPASLETSVTEGPTAKVLLDASKTARMLVVGSRGHGGFAGLLLGSVSTACAEHAGCPVLVAHGDTAPPV